MASLASGSAQLKFVTEYYDRCHETCLQYLMHLQSMDLQAYARWGVLWVWGHMLLTLALAVAAGHPHVRLMRRLAPTQQQ